MQNDLPIVYRPRKFSDMVGNNKTVESLKEYSIKGFPKVMMFEGFTGTGKTTSSLIAAMTINCHSPKIEEKEKIPCGQCSSCKDIINGSFGRDIKTIDASGMSKEDILSLKEKLSISPMYDKNKIFIIDEAQQLGSEKTKGALLLLLEKEYSNCYIILNTMDSQAFNKAIQDRTTKFTFKPLQSKDIANYLFKILEIEGELDKVPDEFITEGLLVISENCEGSVRGALRLLETCINTKVFSKNDILEQTGYSSTEGSFDLLIRILEKDSNVIRELYKVAIKPFFQTTWLNILNAWEYKLLKNEWYNAYQEKYVKAVSKFENLEYLISIYNQLYPYANDYLEYNFKLYYISKISEFISRKTPIKEAFIPWNSVEENRVIEEYKLTTTFNEIENKPKSRPPKT